jgi:hypothetical protein
MFFSGKGSRQDQTKEDVIAGADTFNRSKIHNLYTSNSSIRELLLAFFSLLQISS